MKNRWIGFGLLLLGALMCFVAGNWKFSPVSSQLDVTLKNGDAAQISFSFPDKAWVGEGSTAEVQFSFLSPVDSSTAQLQVKLEIDETDISPRGEIHTYFQPDSPAKVKWIIKPSNAGKLIGSLWVFAGEGENEPEALLAKPIEIKSITFLGITPFWWRVMGVIFLMAAIFLAFVMPVLPKLKKNPVDGKGERRTSKH